MSHFQSLPLLSPRWLSSPLLPLLMSQPFPRPPQLLLWLLSLTALQPLLLFPSHPLPSHVLTSWAWSANDKDQKVGKESPLRPNLPLTLMLQRPGDGIGGSLPAHSQMEPAYTVRKWVCAPIQAALHANAGLFCTVVAQPFR